MAQIPFPSAASQSWVGRIDIIPSRQRLKRIGLALILPIALLIGWQLVVNAEIYSRGQLPAPEDVYRAAEQMAEADQLWIQVEVSLERVLRSRGIDTLLIAEAWAARTSLVGKTLLQLRLPERLGVTVGGVWQRGKFTLGGPQTMITS